MAVATTRQIRQALIDALTRNVINALPQKPNTSLYVLNDPSFPIIWIRPQPNAPIQYHQAMGMGAAGLQQRTFLVEMFFGAISDVSAQENLDAFLDSGGTSDVQGALERDVTLGGVVKSCTVPTCNAYVEFRRQDGTNAIGANWTVEIYP